MSMAGLSSGIVRALDDGATVTLEAQDHPVFKGAIGGVIIELLNAPAGVAQPASVHPRRRDRSVIPAETSSG